ncbi:MAG: TonB-dependent receptor [Ideonella sp.]|nr:TonB-dependent receptor [Ideonella sp.]
MLGTGIAEAQQADQSVVVTGIRRGIENSVTAKRNAEGVSEVISAEDIGKLPDVSIAESLARVPGLAGQRVAGRAQEIQIRGLSGQFAGTLLNGRQQVTTGDNRAVEFDQFPSELINQVTIYKTPDASLIGQGLSGTINMQAARPLDFAGRTVAVNARLESNSNGAVNADTPGNGKRFSASYIDQFANRTVGVALGFAHLDSPGQELHYKAWGFNGPTRDCVAHPEWGGSCSKGLPADATTLNGFEAVGLSRKQVRDGLMGVLEFRPNKDLRSTIDLYFSKFTKDESYRGLMGSIGDAWGGAQGAQFSNVQTEKLGGNTNFVTAANVAGVTNLVVRNDLNTRDDKLKSGGWNTELKLADGWKAIADLSYSNAQRTENVIETYGAVYSGANKALTNFTMVVPSSPALPTLVPNLNFADVTSVKLSDPAGWGHDGLWKKPKANDTIKAMHLEGKKDLSGMFSALDFGLNYTTRTKEREMNELAADLKNGRAPILVPAALQQGPTSLSFVGIPGVAAHDVMGALNSLYDLKVQAADQIINRNYEVFEKVSTAFAKLGIDTAVGGVPVTGNLGLQFIHTDQSSHGWSKLSGNFSEVTRGTTYNDVLPSLNLKAEFADNTILRLGIAKTLARGRMDDMKAGADVNITKNGTTGLTTWGGSGGNPELQPWRAKSFDLSLEKYFGKRSYVAAAAFYKDLGTYIYKQKLIGDFSAFPNTSNPPLATPLNPLGIYERPANGEGGQVHGAELSASIDAGLWHKALDGFGLLGSLSVTASNVHPNGPGTSQKLEGLSGTVRNLTAYYEKNGYQARISQRYRSAFRGEITGLHNAREFSEIQAERQVDLQLGYEFQTGSLKGLSLLLQVNNLTDAPYVTRQGNGFGDVIAVERYDTYGRQVMFGINYKL